MIEGSRVVMREKGRLPLEGVVQAVSGDTAIVKWDHLPGTERVRVEDLEVLP